MQLRKRSFFLTTLWIFILTLASHAAILHVSPSGTAENTGSSWATSIWPLESALERASSGDSIWIAAGVYYVPTEPLQPVRHGSFELKEGVSLYGGFAGTESSLDERQRQDTNGNGLIENWEFTNVTRLAHQSDGSGSVLHYDFPNTATEIVLDGLVISGGDAKTDLYTYSVGDSGGGAHLKGKFTIRNCVFSDNTAFVGGAMHITGEATIESCLFQDNDAQRKGGALCLSGPISVVNSVFIRNGSYSSCTSGGGAIYAEGAADINFCTVIFSESRGPGASIHFAKNSAGSLRNTIVWGSYGNSNSVYAAADLEMSNCAIDSGYLGTNCYLLSDDNSYNGINSNRNTPNAMYVCFTSTSSDSEALNLGNGSVAINRGIADDDTPEFDAAGAARIQNQVPDIGAFESSYKGQLVYDFSLDGDLYYGLTRAINITSADVDVDDLWTITDYSTDYLTIENGFVTGNRYGNYSFVLEISSPDPAIWDSSERSYSINVLRRNLEITIDNAVWVDNGAYPEFTWKLTAGELVDGDEITGEPTSSCKTFPDDNVEYAITRGSLSVTNSNNYSIKYNNGTLRCIVSAATITLSDLTAVYDGKPHTPTVTTDPAGLNYQIIYTYGEYGNYAPSEEPPTEPGSYLVTVQIVDEYYKGNVVETFTIKKATITCTADDASRGVNQPDPEFTYTYQGLLAGDTPDVIDVPPTLISTATADSPAGTYEILVTGAEDDCYEIVGIPGILRITISTPKISNLQATTLEYGQPLSHALLTATVTDPQSGEVVYGEFIWDTPELIPESGTATHTWRFVPESETVYSVITGTADVTVLPREISIKPQAATKLYGDPDPAFNYVITDGKLPNGHNLTVSYTRAAGEELGDYQVQIAEVEITSATLTVNNNYKVVTETGTLTIVKRPLTIVADDITKSRSGEDPELTWTITEGSLLENDAVTGELVREEGELPGEYAITRGTIALPDYYDLTVTGATLTIPLYQLEIYTEPDAEEPSIETVAINYGQPLEGQSQINGVVVNSYNDEVVEGTFYWVRENEILRPGIHNLAWEFIPAESAEHYAEFTGLLQLAIGPGPLTVTVADASREYREANPEFPITITGFLLNDTIACVKEMPTASCAADENSPAGTYPITISGGKSDYYYFQYVPATLTVTPAKVTTNSVQVEGNATALINYGDNLSELEITGDFSVPGQIQWQNPEQVPEVGDTSVQWVFTPDDKGYQTVTGTIPIRVVPATLVITVDSDARACGEENPEFSFDVSGFLNGDTIDCLTTLPSFSCTADKNSPPGIYTITATGATADNYVFIYQPGSLFVYAQPVTMESVTADGLGVAILNYGEPLSTLTIQGTCDVPGTIQWMNPEWIPEVADTTAEWLFVPDDKNYQTLTGTIALDVRPQILTVYIHDKECQVGAALPEFTCEYDGFVNGDDLTCITEDVTLSLEAGEVTTPGLYTIIASGGDAANYIFDYDFHPGTLRVYTVPILVAPELVNNQDAGAVITQTLTFQDGSSDTFDFTVGSTIVATLEEALALPASTGTVLVAQGTYSATSGSFALDGIAEIQAVSLDSNAGEVVFDSPIAVTNSTGFTAKGVTFTCPEETPAVTIDAAGAAVTFQECAFDAPTAISVNSAQGLTLRDCDLVFDYAAITVAQDAALTLDSVSFTASDDAASEFYYLDGAALTGEIDLTKCSFANEEGTGFVDHINAPNATLLLE